MAEVGDLIAVVIAKPPNSSLLTIGVDATLTAHSLDDFARHYDGNALMLADGQQMPLVAGHDQLGTGDNGRSGRCAFAIVDSPAPA